MRVYVGSILYWFFEKFSGQFCSGSRQDFRKLGESKLLTSSATKLKVGQPLNSLKHLLISLLYCFFIGSFGPAVKLGGERNWATCSGKMALFLVRDQPPL